MVTIKHFVSTVAAFTLAVCAGIASAINANATETDVSTKAAIVALETRAYQAWQSKDVKFWESYFSDRFVGYGASGRLDKAIAMQEYSGAGCEVRSIVMSDERVSPLGDAAVLLTYQVTVDGSCAGQKLPANNRDVGIFVPAGETWKAAFHAGTPIVDPAAFAADQPLQQKAPDQHELDSNAPYANTDALMAVELAVWEAWKDNDAERIEVLTAADISFVNIFGMYYANKVDATKDWTSPGCDVQSVSVSDGLVTMLSPTVGILQFTGAADGTCFGQPVGSVWGTSIYVKIGDVWKWTFGINLPARQEG